MGNACQMASAQTEVKNGQRNGIPARRACAICRVRRGGAVAAYPPQYLRTSRDGEQPPYVPIAFDQQSTAQI
eukprot:190401-Rhodomonas_salina.1